MGPESRKLLTEGANLFGIDLTEKAVKAFDLYLNELFKWNRKMNLTAIRSEKEVVLKHFLDSLALVPYLSGISSLLDIGSGAGFPGIPLKMVNLSLEVVLLDSALKKVHFQCHIIRTLKLQGIQAIHGRVQDKGILEKLAGRFDAGIARAFSNLKTLLRFGAPYLRSGGLLIAMKGVSFQKELEDLAPTAISPCRLIKRVDYDLPFSSYRRSLLLFEKE